MGGGILHEGLLVLGQDFLGVHALLQAAFADIGGRICAGQIHDSTVIHSASCVERKRMFECGGFEMPPRGGAAGELLTLRANPSTWADLVMRAGTGPGALPGYRSVRPSG